MKFRVAAGLFLLISSAVPLSRGQAPRNNDETIILALETAGITPSGART